MARMNPQQHRAYVRRLMDKKNKADRWNNEGKFKMMKEEKATDREAIMLSLSTDSLRLIEAVTATTIEICLIKEQLDIGRKTVSYPPIVGDWLESEAVKFIGDQIPNLQGALGDVAKAVNEGKLDFALNSLSELLIKTIGPMYQMGYLNDLILENQARELKETWAVDNPNDPQGAMEQ